MFPKPNDNVYEIVNEQPPVDDFPYAVREPTTGPRRKYSKAEQRTKAKARAIAKASRKRNR